MPKLIQRPDVHYLSELYAIDAPEAALLTEYPSSNSDQTRFRNDRKFLIHDPFPPPPRHLLKSLGPHHLMCGWGTQIPVTSEVSPPDCLLEHWGRVFGAAGVPIWKPAEQVCGENKKAESSDPHAETNRRTDSDSADRLKCITLFPHQTLDAEQQAIDPQVYYHLHSKEAIAEIECPQADVLPHAKFPCIAKLSHGYAGLGNFLLNNEADAAEMQAQLQQQWPAAKLVYNSIVPDIIGDFGIQFYLHRNGNSVWLGLTQQHFDANNRWSGGSFSESLQQEMLEPMTPFVNATAKFLRRHGYFGVVGIDVLKTRDDGYFLVDLNPRLTGISPFLMAARIFAQRPGHAAGVYQASCRFAGSLNQLIETAEQRDDATVLVLSAVEQSAGGRQETICHLSASAASEATSRNVLAELLGGTYS